MAKKLLLSVIALSLAASLSAMCGWNGLTALPSEQKITQNSIFIIEGYGDSQKIISGLENKYQVFLKSGHSRIRLTVKEVLTGKFHITQAVLIPEKRLSPGKAYTLVIENLPAGEFLTRWDKTVKQHVPATYSVSVDTDHENPVLLSVPSVIKKELFYLGCGPSKYVIFNCPVAESSEYVIKATLKYLKSSSETTYYIQPGENQILIGHGMCSGAFDFGVEMQYEIEFSVMDMSGNVSSECYKTIFSRPTQEGLTSDTK